MHSSCSGHPYDVSLSDRKNDREIATSGLSRLRSKLSLCKLSTSTAPIAHQLTPSINQPGRPGIERNCLVIRSLSRYCDPAQRPHRNLRFIRTTIPKCSHNLVNLTEPQPCLTNVLSVTYTVQHFLVRSSHSACRP